jgi:hypothetical protein
MLKNKNNFEIINLFFIVRLRTFQSTLVLSRVSFHNWLMSCLKNGKNNLEYAQVGNFYTSQQFLTIFTQHG